MHREKTGGSWERMESAAVLAHLIHRAQKNSRCSLTNWQRNPAHSSSNGHPMSELETQFYKWSIGLWLDRLLIIINNIVNQCLHIHRSRKKWPYFELSDVSFSHQMMFMLWSDAIAYPLKHMLQHITTAPSHVSYITFKNHLNST